MTSEHLTGLLAQRVMGWEVGPGRFLTGGRGWLPRWRFQPVLRMADTSRLLEKASPQEYALGAAENGLFGARVQIAGQTGEACERSQARAMTLAIARAIGLKVDEVE